MKIEHYSKTGTEIRLNGSGLRRFSEKIENYFEELIN